MAHTKDHEKSHGFTLVRSAKGNGRGGRIDIDRALEVSSSSASLADLQSRGYSRVKVVDRRKIAMLVRQALDEAVPLDEEPEAAAKPQETEAGKRFEELIRQPARSPGLSGSEKQHDRRPPERPAPESNLNGLSAIVAELVETQLSERDADAGRLRTIEERMEHLEEAVQKAEPIAAPHEEPVRPPARESLVEPPDLSSQPSDIGDIVERIEPVRLKAIERRMDQLEEVLGRAERTLDRLSTRKAYPAPMGRAGFAPGESTELQQSLLDAIFRHNVQLQVSKADEAQAAAKEP